MFPFGSGTRCNVLLLIGGSMSDAGKGGESQAGAGDVARPADKDVQRVLQGMQQMHNKMVGGLLKHAPGPSSGLIAVPSLPITAPGSLAGCVLSNSSSAYARQMGDDPVTLTPLRDVSPPFVAFPRRDSRLGLVFATTGIAHGGVVSINRSMTGSCCVLGSRPSALDTRGGCQCDSVGKSRGPGCGGGWRWAEQTPDEYRIRPDYMLRWTAGSSRSGVLRLRVRQVSRPRSSKTWSSSRTSAAQRSWGSSCSMLLDSP